MWKRVGIAIFMVLLLVGCKKEKESSIIQPVITKEPTVEPTVEPTKSPTPKPVVSHKGQERSKISGLWIKKDLVQKRPYAFMFNNIKLASPQSGISEASVLYEAVVEGGITRLMGIFEDFSSDRIGSARSARHYFVSFADEYDAIFVHFGQTKYAITKMDILGTDNLSGLEGVGSTVFYRDSSIKEPHNAFASFEGIQKGTKQKGYRTKIKKDVNNHYNFFEEDTPVEGESVKKVSLGFSKYTTPYFEYNSKKKLFYRFQFDGPHKDANTGKQLAFKNILIQMVKEWNIDKKGYQTMDIENSSGTGYYLTDGKVKKILWKKKESSKEMQYYNTDGTLLTVNPGKTYIGVFPNNREEYCVFQ